MALAHARLAPALAALALVPCLGAAHPAPAQRLWRISVSGTGADASGLSDRPVLSADGRLVVFTSKADDLVGNDGNGKVDVFLHDLEGGATRLVSVNLQGAAGNGDCLWPVISADGSSASFSSLAGDLVPGDTNNQNDIFVRDLASGVTARVNVSSAGAQANSGGRGSALSAEGRFCAFVSAASNLVPGDTNGVQDIFVHDRSTGVTERVSVSTAGVEADGNCGGPWLSADGRFVTFGSEATNLVPGDANLMRDVFLHDRASGTTTRASVSSSGAEGNSLSGFNHLTGYFTTFLSPDARWIVFHSYASNLVPGDANGAPDIFVHDRLSGATERVSVASDGTESDGSSYFPVLFGRGRWVSFFSTGSTLAAGDANGAGDVFVHDRWTGVTSRLSVNLAGAEGDLGSDYPTASADGSVIVFESEATNLVRGDANGAKDLFARTLEPDCPEPVISCPSGPSGLGCAPVLAWSGHPSASSVVPFVLRADGLAGAAAGMLIYGTQPAQAPFAGGTLCIGAPVRRTGLQPTGGAASSCEGSLAFDFSALVHSHVDPELVAGRSVHVQFWTRDPASTAGAHLSDGASFTLCL